MEKVEQRPLKVEAFKGDKESNYGGWWLGKAQRQEEGSSFWESEEQQLLRKKL